MTNTATKSPIQILRDAVEAARAYHGITLASMPPQDAWVYHRVSERLTEALRLTEGTQDAPGEPVADNRRCKPCAATRGGTHCWKCGAETFEPSPLAGDDPKLPPIDRIRELAKEVGYAIGVHGSQQRDLDVIAAPWTDMAIGNHALLEHIAKGLTTDNGPAHIISTSRKPLGRYAATIQMDGWYKQLDISVCPNSQYESLRHPAPGEAVGEIVAATNGDTVKWSDFRIPPVGTRLYAHPAPTPTAEVMGEAVEAEEDAALIQKLSKLLAGVAVALNGPEPKLARWSYHDLPEKAATLMLELEIFRAQEKSIAELAPDCTRSHPHEDMDAACEAKTVQARADFKRAGAEHAKRADGERALFEATFDPFEFRRDYDKFGPSEAAFAVWQARGQQQAGVPEWISVDDQLPEVGVMVLVYSPQQQGDYPDDVRISFDCIDPDADDPAYWLSHGEHYEHYCCIAKGEDCTGPSEKAPYTHWMPIPAAPGVGP